MKAMTTLESIRLYLSALWHTIIWPKTTFGQAVVGSVRISVSGEVIPGAAQRGCPLYLRCSMPDLMR